MFGFISINKPIGLTSRRCVDVVKKLVRPDKVGHSGTLDPLASGVLVVCVGPATRLNSFVQQQPKSYIGDFRLGVSSPTDDLEGELKSCDNPPVVEAEQIEAVLPEFVGEISQVPPAYSAVKIDGRRAYKLARSGREVEVKPRNVTVHQIELLKFEYPEFKLRIECGSGTYIRSIGRDLGRRLDSSAVMTGLIRTAVGPFKISNSLEPDNLDEATLARNLVPPASLFSDLPEVALNEKQIVDLINGVIMPASVLGTTAGHERIMAVDDQGRLLALLCPYSNDSYKPEINFAHYFNQ